MRFILYLTGLTVFALLIAVALLWDKQDAPVQGLKLIGALPLALGECR